MRRSIVFIVLYGFLFGQANLGELAKVPALISHFCDHQTENPALGFFEFIHAHYCHEHFHCTQHENDQSLPFQTCDFHFAYLMPAAPEVLAAQGGRAGDGIEHVSHYREPNFNQLAIDIWQPPKL